MIEEVSKMKRVTLLAVVVLASLNIVQCDDSENSGADTADERSGRAVATAHASSYASGVHPIHGGVECYICTDCPSVQVNTTTKICPPTIDSVKQRSCVTYSEHFKYMKRPWVIRGCASERGSCAEIKQTHSQHTDVVSLISCNECIGDRCNTSGATKTLADFTIAFLVLIVTPLVGKITLS